MKHKAKAGALALAFVLAFALALPVFAYVRETEEKVVRVGWYESPFNYMDRFGRRSGYAYEYQQKIAAYTGWKYEYVEESFPELLEMVKTGDIDLMSDVSYTEERAGEMLFSALSMGAEVYHVFISATNTEITAGKKASLNGKKVGVNKNSFQEKLFLDWEAENGVHAEIVELTGTQDASVQLLESGEIDAFVTIDAFGDEYTHAAVFKIGQSDFYFTVNQTRPDLLDSLNSAMSKIQDEYRGYNQRMYDKFVRNIGTNAFLAGNEADWLSRHGAIRVGYLEDCLPFCAVDKTSRELTGALKDYLELAAHSQKNAEISFQSVPYATQEAALDALRDGKVDCVFPVCLSSSDGEDMGVLVTTPFMETAIYAAVRKSDHLGISPERQMTVAVNAGNANDETFLKDYFPDWNAAHYAGTEACFREVSLGHADCVLMSNYRLAQTENLRDRYKLSTLTTGAAMSYSFAIRRPDSELYYILNKTASIIPRASVDSALMAYSWPDDTFSMSEFIEDNLALVIAVILLAAFSIVFLIARRAERMKQDFAKEMALQHALSDALTAAEEANRAKSAFLSNMSHEIRTPINAVLGLNEMILRESDDANVLAYAGSIQTAGATLLGLINDILDFSKIEAGKMEIIPVDYELSSILNDLVNMIQTKADDKGLTLVLDFDETTPRLLRGDEVRIKQVITNILTNAVKYTEKGSVTFHVGYERIPGEPDNMYLDVFVKDTGIGMKPEDLKKLFSEFERIEEKRNRNIEGTGLGMSITRNLLELMGTSLQVESVYGEGSKFSFRLKQKVVKWEPLGDYEAAYRASMSGRKKYKEKFTAPNAVVLVVDDTPMNLMVFKSLLNRTRVRIDLASGGDEGLGLARDKKYDIIFLDHMMPEKDGIETLHEMREQKNNPNLKTPVICLTANAISGAREKYLAEGFDDYLTKPIDSAKLEEMLMQYLPEDKIRQSGADDENASGNDTEAVPKELEALRGQDWIDVSAGIKNSGSVEAYLPLLQIFYTSLDEKADEIERFYKERDYRNYTIKVHAVKSSARIIGAAAFGEEAQLLENAGNSQDADYILEHHDAFMEKLRSFREPLSKVFAAEERDKPEADADMMVDVFEEIRAAAGDMDCDRLQDVFTEMEEYRIPAEYAALWDALSEASGQYD